MLASGFDCWKNFLISVLLPTEDIDFQPSIHSRLVRRFHSRKNNGTLGMQLKEMRIDEGR